MSYHSEFGSDYAQEQLRRSRHPLRRIIKHFYINNILQDVEGPSIDFGCGAGQLLARLPAGSLGLEVNPFLVEALQKNGLNVQLYNPEQDQFSLADLAVGSYRTFVMAHVLEHLPDAARHWRTLLTSCRRLGIHRAILILPGAKGFRSDPTHRTFVDHSYLEREGLLRHQGYAVTRTQYFPLNLAAIGNHFTFHELKVVYESA